MACPYCGSTDVEREGGHWRCNVCGERWDGGWCRKDPFTILKDLTRRSKVRE